MRRARVAPAAAVRLAAVTTQGAQQQGGRAGSSSGQEARRCPQWGAAGWRPGSNRGPKGSLLSPRRQRRAQGMPRDPAAARMARRCHPAGGSGGPHTGDPAGLAHARPSARSSRAPPSKCAGTRLRPSRTGTEPTDAAEEYTRTAHAVNPHPRSEHRRHHTDRSPLLRRTEVLSSVLPALSPEAPRRLRRRSGRLGPQEAGAIPFLTSWWTRLPRPLSARARS